jgi:hypothetical protein
MNKKLILLFLALPLLGGCALVPRPFTDAIFGAGGGLLGDKLGHGNSAAIAGGAGGGVLLSEGFQFWKSKDQQKAYTDGYITGKSDGVKSVYWNLQGNQRPQP